MRPTWRLPGALALSTVLLWYATTSEVPWLYLLSAWLLALTIAAAVYAWWNRAGLQLSLEPRAIRPAAASPLEELPEQLLRTAPLPAAIFEEDTLELEVGLDTSGAARGPASVAGDVGGTRITFATGLVPRSGWRETAVVAGLRRGPIGAASWEIGAGDFLGLFRGRSACEDFELGLVLPRFASLAGRWQPREVEASAAAPRAGFGTELFGVREYRPGDSLRRIHWRSTARRGELTVREYEPPGQRLLTVVVDAAPARVELADQIARIAASEAWDCLREGGRVSVLAPGLEPLAATRDLWAVLEWLSRYPGPSAGHAISSLRGEDVVVVTAGDREAIELATERIWIVGDAEVHSDVPEIRVGTAWPL